MAAIITREVGVTAKNSPLTNAELDNNFINLNNDIANLSAPALASPSSAGLMSASDKTKLDGVAAGATVNSSDAQLKDRANHSGEQAISTVTGLATALNDKAPLNGTGTSGTWPISISGAATAPTLSGYLGGYTLADTNAGVTGGYTLRYVALNAANKPAGIDGNLQTIAYSASWATQIYSDWRTNEWSVRALNNGVWTVWRNLLHSGNFGTYAPTLTGAGASGNWSINAATATKLATSRTINGIAFDGTANISVPVDWSSVTGKPAVIAAGADQAAARTAIDAASATDLAAKQDALVSGANIKTVGGQSLLGSGNIPTSDPLSTAITIARTNGVITSMTETVGGTPRVTTITRSGGVVTQIAVAHNGTTRTETLTRTNGQVTDITVTET